MFSVVFIGLWHGALMAYGRHTGPGAARADHVAARRLTLGPGAAPSGHLSPSMRLACAAAAGPTGKLPLPQPVTDGPAPARVAARGNVWTVNVFLANPFVF